MTRAQIIVLSVVCCAFGGVALSTDGTTETAAYAANVVLAVACYLAAGRDLVARGWDLGYLFAGAYLLPLVGLIVYIGLSHRPKTEAPAVGSADA